MRNFFKNISLLSMFLCDFQRKQDKIIFGRESVIIIDLVKRDSGMCAQYEYLRCLSAIVEIYFIRDRESYVGIRRYVAYTRSTNEKYYFHHVMHIYQDSKYQICLRILSDRFIIKFDKNVE